MPEPILGIRALAYQGEGRPGLLPPIAGLRVQAVGVIGARPCWDAATAQTRFDELPPGTRQFLVSDPERRFLPAALVIDIPSRYPARPTAAHPAPASQAPVRRTLLLRPAPGRAIPAGVTAVIGTLRDASGRGVALARLACATGAGDRGGGWVTWTDADGGFVLLLPEDGAAAQNQAAPMAVPLAVHAPLPPLAARLVHDPLGALPPDLDQHDPETMTGLFARRAVTLHAPDGTRADAPPGQLPIRPGRTLRWDLALA